MNLCVKLYVMTICVNVSDAQYIYLTKNKLQTKVDKERYSTPALGGKMSGGGILQMDDVKFYWETIKLLFSNILQLCFDIETDKCVAPPITFVY